MSKSLEKSGSSKLRTTDDREQAGKSLREKAPRLSHGKLILGQGDKRDVVALIEASNQDRLENLIPVRHGRMLQSPFAFFRGTAALQAYDLAGTPTSGIVVQACGDCHLMNFGGFATPERNLVFDINDFDETFPAPFEWDLKRLAASFVVAARWRGFKKAQAREIAVAAASSYRKSMRKRSGSGVLESWYSMIAVKDVQEMAGVDDEMRERIRKNVADARKQTHEHVLQKLTRPSRGLPRIIDQPPLLYHAGTEGLSQREIAAFFKLYRETLPEERRMLFDRFKLVDIALKVVGVGSVGTRCWAVLLLATPEDSLFLQVKEARPSVLEPYTRRSPWSNNGERIVVGQRLMQTASDIFLGWSKGPTGRNFYVRQLRDMKIGVHVETQEPQMMAMQARLSGMALARAHDKAGDAAMIAGYLGKADEFDEAIGDYAVGYADQVERDYEAFVKAARSGRLKSDLSSSRLEALLR
jgi:uncharacterized protein (DUF2252 family)